jgi:hypothetical protein
MLEPLVMVWIVPKVRKFVFCWEDSKVCGVVDMCQVLVLGGLFGCFV